MTRRLPPLNAVRAFEASARLGSLTLAADELCVTPGAVSQQIKKLEDYYGRQLLVRRNNQLQLTDLGQSVYGTCAELMDRLAAMTQRIVGGTEQSHLIISVLPSVGVRWLNRRLPEFLAAFPELRIDLRLEEDPVDFFRNRIDVRISYGEHLYQEFITVPFARDRVTAMCAPELLRSGRVQPGAPDELRDEDLIHTLWRTGFSTYPTWESWLAAAGAPRSVRTETGHKTDTVSLALDLAAAGAGIALGQYLLAADALDSGALVAPYEIAPSLSFQYCAVYTPAGRQNPMVRQFVDWLVERGRPL
ncbi:MAG: LysR family transcriptional regulator [Gammaproteobacteria bacterium]|nr:LysR family transcriptional regulator [Gammaproteobacteria bacterium]